MHSTMLAKSLVLRAGLEPATLWLKARCSNQLSYRSVIVATITHMAVLTLKQRRIVIRRQPQLRFFELRFHQCRFAVSRKLLQEATGFLDVIFDTFNRDRHCGADTIRFRLILIVVVSHNCLFFLVPPRRIELRLPIGLQGYSLDRVLNGIRRRKLVAGVGFEPTMVRL
jgi:hypothetical protein